ncbi:hypothetical protein [Mycobacteroides abscessus]|uniref:hypothetical protein n=1 Tax=Mycobacteroides abscessus TaxID=36809 RepID=UPI000925B876|nr:hypothetical protein [Mycobacteroides abscessus]SHP69238.1 Uncharacterised protein [Mycobacteroides abscessus subsp. bolletii]SHS16825.1 Uncharacterised protein [Mycobacteroides abscessus subsp. bolletii]SHS88451.1 Uncharacterised protein [Mycobacteroides abscessus subsp. bolletii]SKF65635.1 Uncharacterised protein [Mycobacteroides abscessus subsp. bolletii]SKG30173.1 Uncharacterised protein [Mycobacteroides abscessus subsp. bolletii]
MLDINEASYTRRIASGDLASVGIANVIFGDDIDEDRANATVAEVADLSDAKIWRIDLKDDAICHIDGYNGTVNLFETGELRAFIESIEGSIAIDLTSLEHRIWAPFTRVLVEMNRHFVALYAEPDDYRRSNEVPGAVYDLSTTRGIEPLPGFARISKRSDELGYFAPLLGFEGARLGHIFDQEEVEIARTSPVIGLPGFRIEYPTLTYLANRDMLSLDHMERRVEFARASCPFEAYRAIERIHYRSGRRHLRIAPIGTKPHALGAVLYAIRNTSAVELIYDHPVRAKGRTHGSRNIYVFEVSDFIDSLGVE